MDDRERAEVRSVLQRLLGADGGEADLDAAVHGVVSALESLTGESARAAGAEVARADLELEAGDARACEPEEPLIERLRQHRPAMSRYRLLGEHMRGGMGVILEVLDLDLGRRIAMKILRASALGPPSESSQAARFLEEARLSGQLDHPGIVPVHELGMDESGRLYFTMRLVRGEDLREVLRLAREGAAGWSRTRVLGVLLKVCETVAYAHERGVVHRDLKPANVMVGRFGEVYVLDWGVAKLLANAEQRETRSRGETAREDELEAETPVVTAAGTVVGTPAYMPPEQARGEVEPLDRRADVYAVGAMLYELLTGEPPFLERGERAEPSVVLSRLAKGPPRSIEARDPSVPPELVAICERAMAREREQRYADMTALAGDLRAYLEGRVVRAWRTGPLVELSKWVRRNPGWATAAALAITALVTGSLWRARVEKASQRELELSSDPYLHQSLLLEERELWPSHPDRIARHEDWLRRAEELLSRRRQHEQRRSRANLPELERDRETELLAGLDRLDAPDGLLADVRERLAVARTVEARTVSGPGVAELWAAALATIADPDLCPSYRGLRIGRQIGLIPIGRDPRSLLLEFALWRSGAVPERDANGDLVLSEASAVVLALLPGGTFWMGASNPSDALPNPDPRAAAVEGPVQRVELAPFFLSKFELTCAQWERMTGERPSVYGPGEHFGAFRHTALHPVEQVSWFTCERELMKLGLALPTEAQWEYAARASEQTPWSCGATVESLRGHANVADLMLARYIPEIGRHSADFPELDDGYALHAPVGSFAANPFGLHDVYGNVWEWCRESYVGYGEANAAGLDGYRSTAGLVPTRDHELRVLRGGAWNRGAFQTRSAFRLPEPPENAAPNIGVRPTRALLTP